MGSMLWTVVSLLAFALLVFSTYAAFVGVRRGPQRCPLLAVPALSHHYLNGHTGQWTHACPHGITERAYQAAWAQLHHTGVRPR
jgi:hypothetical protein